MRLLKKTNAAGDGKRNVTARKLQLHFQRVKMRTIQHRHVIQLNALLAQLQRALRDERRLFIGRTAHGKHRLFAGATRGRQFLGELPRVGRDGGIGQLQDLRRAAVIGFDFVHLRAGIALGKLDDVFVIGAAPRIDTLRIVADHHHVFVSLGQQINQLRLQLIGVLIFVHEHELKPFLVQLADVLVFLEQLQPKHQQVIKIHQALRLFTSGVAREHILDLGGQRLKPRVAFLDHLAHGLLLVDRQ